MAKAIWFGKNDAIDRWGSEHSWVTEICENYGHQNLLTPSWSRRGMTLVDRPVKAWDEEWQLTKDKLIDPVLVGAEFYLIEAALAGALYDLVGVTVPDKIARRVGLAQSRLELEAKMADLEETAARTLFNYGDMIVGGELRHCDSATDLVKSKGRRVCWADWKPIREQLGSDALLDAELHFVDLTANGSYCGPPWANIAATMRWYEEGRLTSQGFIDRCMNLEHNGGNFLNKLDSSWLNLNNLAWTWGHTKLVGEAHNDGLWVLVALLTDDIYWMLAAYTSALNRALVVMELEHGAPRHQAALPMPPSYVLRSPEWQFEERVIPLEAVVRDSDARDSIAEMKKILGLPAHGFKVPKLTYKQKDSLNLKKNLYDNYVNPWGLLSIPQIVLLSSRASWKVTEPLLLSNPAAELSCIPTTKPKHGVTYVDQTSPYLLSNTHFFLLQNISTPAYNLGVFAMPSVANRRIDFDFKDLTSLGNVAKPSLFHINNAATVPNTFLMKCSPLKNWSSNKDAKWSIPDVSWQKMSRVDVAILCNVALMTDRWWKSGNTSAGITHTLVEWDSLPKAQKNQYLNGGIAKDLLPGVLDHMDLGADGAYGFDENWTELTINPQHVSIETMWQMKADNWSPKTSLAPTAAPAPIPTPVPPTPVVKMTELWGGIYEVVPVDRDNPVEEPEAEPLPPQDVIGVTDVTEVETPLGLVTLYPQPDGGVSVQPNPIQVLLTGKVLFNKFLAPSKPDEGEDDG